MVAPALIGAGIGAALGLLKTNQQKKDVERMNRAQAAITAYSPWTGMRGQMQAAPSSFGGILQGAALGAMTGGAAGAAGVGAGAAGTAGTTAGTTAASTTAGTTAGTTAASTGGAGVGLGAANTGGQVAQTAAQNEAYNQAAMQYGQQGVAGMAGSGIPGLDAQAPNYSSLGTSGGSALDQNNKWAQMGQQQAGMYNRRYF